MMHFKKLSIWKLKFFQHATLKRFSSEALGGDRPKNYNWMLVFPMAAFGLGTWQVQRLQWKKGLIKDLELRTQREAVPLNPTQLLETDQLKAMEYNRVKMSGVFDHTQEIFLGPRSKNEKHPTGGGGGGLISHGPKTGYHIITPFILDSGERILINRGWVGRDFLDPEKRPAGQVTDRVQLSGLVRKSERRPSFSPKIRDDSLQWHYCDVESFSRLLDTLPVLIDADSASTISGGPLGGQTRVTLRNEHMQYIITWYSLCLATLFLYYQLRKKPASMFKGPTVKE